VDVTLKPDLLTDIGTTARRFMKRNVTPVKDLRSFIGKCSHVSTLIYVWRPFLTELWGALSSASSSSSSARGRSKGPPQCVWLRQIQSAVQWLLAFLDGRRGTVHRVYQLDGYLGRGRRMRVLLDASPWGLGAALFWDDQPAAWFTSELTPADCEIFGHAIGSSSGQQTWEALVVLVALRIWLNDWRDVRASLEATSDSVSALTLLLSLKARGAGPAIVAREVALLLGDAAFRPNAVIHTPGVSHVIADALSRRYQPGVAFRVPLALAGAKEMTAPPRPRAYYKALGSPNDRDAGAW
jgi:hypothetical protein